MTRSTDKMKTKDDKKKKKKTTDQRNQTTRMFTIALSDDARDVIRMRLMITPKMKYNFYFIRDNGIVRAPPIYTTE